MSSINSVSNIQSFVMTSDSGQVLKQTTIERLLALGIDPTTVTSETQAQILIAQAEAAKNQQNNGNLDQKEQGGNSSEQQLLSEVKSLAQSVGVSVSAQDSAEDIIVKISQKLEVMAKEPSQGQKVEGYQSRLESLAQRADVIVNTQENIFNTMDMISVSNKLILGL